MNLPRLYKTQREEPLGDTLFNNVGFSIVLSFLDGLSPLDLVGFCSNC